LIWPTEEGSIIYIIFLGALFPIILSTMHGVEQTPEILVRAAVARRIAPANFWSCRAAGGVAEHLCRSRDRHGRVVVFSLLTRPLLAWQERGHH